MKAINVMKAITVTAIAIGGISAMVALAAVGQVGTPRRATVPKSMP
jgi:hypothetical protein